MKQRVKKLWLKALRSGKYKQARGRLRKKEDKGFAYCCLGVLEKLRCDEQGKRFPTRLPRGNVLSTAAMKWAGLTDDNPNLTADGNGKSAAELNDEGKSFKYIARRIEKYL